MNYGSAPGCGALGVRLVPPLRRRGHGECIYIEVYDGRWHYWSRGVLVAEATSLSNTFLVAGLATMLGTGGLYGWSRHHGLMAMIEQPAREERGEQHDHE